MFHYHSNNKFMAKRIESNHPFLNNNWFVVVLLKSTCAINGPIVSPRDTWTVEISWLETPFFLTLNKVKLLSFYKQLTYENKSKTLTLPWTTHIPCRWGWATWSCVLSATNFRALVAIFFIWKWTVVAVNNFQNVTLPTEHSEISGSIRYMRSGL